MEVHISSPRDLLISDVLVLVKAPRTKSPRVARPRQCPYCESHILQRWGRVAKSVHDPQIRQAFIHRFRCADCARTFRSYPDGLDRGNRSLSLRRLAAMAWGLGLSLDAVVSLFASLGIQLSRSSIWRYGRGYLSSGNLSGETRQVALVGVNRPLSAEDLDLGEILVILDLGGRQWAALEVFDESGPRSAKAWLMSLAQELDLEASILSKN